tara:strand:+ start:58 stop:840 length:783 start_codon:yes stop_codon:yes gene_type:complete
MEKTLAIYGQTKELTTPSGFKVTIREQNGNDDDIISNANDAKDLTNLDKFISSLVIKTDLPYAINNRIPLKDMGKMLLRDKYFIIFASRIHSISKDMDFTFQWDNEHEPVHYNENLEIFIWDYSKEFPSKPEDEGYYKHKILPYPKDAHDKIEHVLTSGKNIRFELLKNKGEKYLMKLDSITRNSAFKARYLERKIDNDWVTVENFSQFTKKDMSEISKLIKDIDPDFTGITVLENPDNPGEEINFPIMKTESFFYPEEI